MIPVKINKTLEIESIDDTVVMHDVSGPMYGDIIRIEHILNANRVGENLVCKNTDLVNDLCKEMDVKNSIFYLKVCDELLFIVEEDRDISFEK